MRVMILLSGLLSLVGCSAYHGGYEYEPRPVEVRLLHDESPSAGEVRTLVTIIGVRRADDELAQPRSVEARVRVDNASELTVTIDPASLSLTDADVNRFDPPRTEPRSVVAVEPSESATISAWFAFPDGSADMAGLHLNWVLMDIHGGQHPQSATFSRRVYEPSRRFGYGHQHGYGGGYFGYSRYWCH